MMVDQNDLPASATLIRQARAQLKALSAAWIAAGANYLGFYDPAGECRWQFPPDTPAAIRAGAPAVLCAPIHTLNRPLGELRVRIPHSNEIELWRQRLQTDAALLAGFFQLEEDLEGMTAELINAQDQLLAFYQLAHSISDQLDIEGAMQTLAREATRLVKATAGFMALEREDEFLIVQYPPEYADNAIFGEAYLQTRRNGREQLLGSAQAPPGMTNLLVLPITIRGQIQAGLGLLDKAGEFASPDLKLARAIAEAAGAHIERVLLHEETLRQARLKTELDMAAAIQYQLLPQQIPSVVGLDVYGKLIQARQIGGDFYLYAQHSADCFLLAVGDVAGKGISAALMMAITRTVILSHAHTVPLLSPGEMMTLTNADLYDDYTRICLFTTLFMGCYRPESRELQYSNGGHSPVVYCPAGGKAQLLKAADLPLGVLPDHRYTNQKLLLNPGDVLIIATDGFNEARNDRDELFGYDRLLALVERNAQRSARAIADVMLAAIHTFGAGHPQDDDETLMVIKALAG